MENGKRSEDLDETEVGSNQSPMDWSIQTCSGVSCHYDGATPRVRYGFFETFRTSSEIMPGQPAAVTLMTDEVRESPSAGEFLRQHVRATEFIAHNPTETAAIVEDGIGMPADQAEQALAGPLANFVTDPQEIMSGTEIFAEFAAENGQTDEQLTTDQVFDTNIYNNL